LIKYVVRLLHYNLHWRSRTQTLINEAAYCMRARSRHRSVVSRHSATYFLISKTLFFDLACKPTNICLYFLRCHHKKFKYLNC